MFEQCVSRILKGQHGRLGDDLLQLPVPSQNEACGKGRGAAAEKRLRAGVNSAHRSTALTFQKGLCPTCQQTILVQGRDEVQLLRLRRERGHGEVCQWLAAPPWRSAPTAKEQAHCGNQPQQGEPGVQRVAGVLWWDWVL